MSKKWAPAAAIVIASCFLAYLFQPGNEPEPGGASRPAPGDPPTEEKQTPGEKAGPTKKEPGNSSKDNRSENTIAGRIVATAPAGASAEPIPLAGATISLLNQPRKRVKSAESGAFLLSPVARLANDLQVRAAGYGTVTRLRVPAGAADLLIRLEKEFELTGKTVFADGSPAAGIELLLHAAASVEADPFSRASALHSGRPPEAKSTSGEDGSFTIGALSQGDWFLRVRGPGIIEQVLDGVVKVSQETRPVEIVVERGNLIRGRVVNEAGKALAGIEVRLQTELDASISRTFSTSTGSEGEFLFNRLGESPCELLAGAASDYLPLVISEVRPGQDLLIELAEGWVLNGRIIDAKTSRPLRGAEALWGSPETSAIPATYRQDRSDGEGNFSL
ncbi:MAG: carboxypeptidase-like regulatory domain-containing protein, partial [Planctomycetota bacterium]|nr:carboxypeptidase-like regulatory domain-containing protein [Planctomycetota bacterium]